MTRVRPGYLPYVTDQARELVAIDDHPTRRDLAAKAAQARRQQLREYRTAYNEVNEAVLEPYPHEMADQVLAELDDVRQRSTRDAGPLWPVPASMAANA